jgi:prepilin-type N-terminal cleavage/methylation domain-containing protein
MLFAPINMKKGFTLFELLVSISIIGILTAIAVMSFSSAQKKARDSRRIQDMNIIQKAAEQYYSQNNYTYPANSDAFVSGGVLQAWPVDPKGVGVGATAYVYNAETTYCACAGVENTASGNSTTATCGFAASGNYFCVKNQQ